MLPFLRPRNDKDIGDKLVGKRRKYRLPRNGAAVGLVGTLLAFYRREVLPDGLMPPSGGRVELFAVIRTQAGRFFCYYVVSYPETEDIAGRQEYAHVCPDFEAVRDFLGAMAYPNRIRFAEALLTGARQTLSVLDPAGYPPLPAAAGPEAAPADPAPDAPSGVLAAVPPDAPADAPADAPPAPLADSPSGSPTDGAAGTVAPVPETDSNTPRSRA